jgi:hypothetical protein
MVPSGGTKKEPSKNVLLQVLPRRRRRRRRRRSKKASHSGYPIIPTCSITATISAVILVTYARNQLKITGTVVAMDVTSICA